MEDFNEAVLTIKVKADAAEVYKAAIEAENSPNGLRDYWGGNYAHVVIGDRSIVYGENKPLRQDTVELTIQLLSHTLLNLKQTVKWYKDRGCTVDRLSYS